MPCAEFEDLLIRYAELTPDERRRADAHLRGCPECQIWLEALASVDAALTAEFEGVRAPVTLAAALRNRLPRPRPQRVSAMPEILDFVGWLGVILAAGLVACFSLPDSFAVSPTVLWTSVYVLLCLALSVTVWALRGNER